MLSIGAFAQVGQVTHRMLRHWDQAGLLVPAHTDPFTGYRSYDPEQVHTLHRIVALRHLGFGIPDVAALIDDGIDTADLSVLLQRRRDEAELDYQRAAAQLADVERRLHLMERNNTMSQAEVLKKPLPEVRLAARVTTVAEQPEIGGVVGPSFDAVAEVIGGTCGALEVPLAVYAQVENGIEVTVGYQYSGEPQQGIEIVTLAREDTAFVSVHVGDIAEIPRSWQSLHEEIVARGYEPSGPCREYYLRADESGRTDEFVVELQQPVRPVASAD